MHKPRRRQDCILGCVLTATQLLNVQTISLSADKLGVRGQGESYREIVLLKVRTYPKTECFICVILSKAECPRNVPFSISVAQRRPVSWYETTVIGFLR